MAKKEVKVKKSDVTEAERRQSRKDLLLARKQERQLRQIKIGAAIVAAVLVLVLIVAVVNELWVIPNRAAATVNGQAISLRVFQERVRFERAQRIISLENQLEAFQGDVGIIQQFAGQAILELQDAEALGQAVLNRMIDEEIIRQAAVERGIVVTDEDVSAEIGSFFNFYGGGLPTPQPTATQTPAPTPSLTPIPAVITDTAAVETPSPTATLGPTSTPLPTQTPVSQATFDEQYGELLADFRAYGIQEQAYREAIRMRIYTQRLLDALVEDADLPETSLQASLFLLSYATEEAAQVGLAEIQASDYLTVWNTVRSNPPEPDEEGVQPVTASEILWRTQEELVASLGAQGAEVAFSLPLNTPSAPLALDPAVEETRYLIVQVSGREVRPLSASALQASQQQLLSDFIEQQVATGVVINDVWRSRVPTTPILDAKFLAPPTPAPTPLPEESLPATITP